MNLGSNVKVTAKGNKVILEIDTTQDLGLSGSGKSTKIASTNGNVPLGDAFPGIRLGLNMYRPVEQRG